MLNKEDIDYNLNYLNTSIETVLDKVDYRKLKDKVRKDLFFIQSLAMDWKYEHKDNMDIESQNEVYEIILSNYNKWITKKDKLRSNVFKKEEE